MTLLEARRDIDLVLTDVGNARQHEWHCGCESDKPALASYRRHRYVRRAAVISETLPARMDLISKPFNPDDL